MESAKEPMTARQKAKKLGGAIGKAGAEAISSTLLGRGSSKEKRVKSAADLVEMSEMNLSGKSQLGRVTMGMPPTMEEEGIPMKSAMDLISSPYKPSFGTDDTPSIKSAMGKEVAAGIQRDRSAINYAQLDKIKRKLGWKSERRNPYLYPKPGAAGSEDVSSTLLGQLNKSKPPLRGGRYES